MAFKTGYCGICHEERKISKHHLSYDPEIMLDVCFKCHLMLHRIKIEVLQKIIDLKKQYEKLWDDATNKYMKSPRHKGRLKMYKKSTHYKEWAKRNRKTEYQIEHRMRYTRTPEYRAKRRIRYLKEVEKKRLMKELLGSAMRPDAETKEVS